MGHAVAPFASYGGGMTTLSEHAPAPPFSLSDQDGTTVRLEDYHGCKVLVYFYPEADTPGCTTQSCDLRDHRQALSELGIDVVGISPDAPEAQLAFDRKYHLGFPLLADEDHSVADAWGTWRTSGDDGASGGIVRSSFLVDEDGRIERAWYRVKPAETAPKALDAVRGSP
jgi:thioredoxin-dependent peroxiredoxin